MASVLKIRDKNGKFIGINAIRGDNGKSAYEQAKVGGYKGTEEEFIALLNGTLDSSSSKVCYASDDLDNEIQQGGDKVVVCNYHSGTLNTPYSARLTVYAHGMVITNAHSSECGTQLCMPSGDSNIYVRGFDKNGVQAWRKVVVQEDIEWLDSFYNAEFGEVENNVNILWGVMPNFYYGSYSGTGKYGESNPNTLDLGYDPMVVFVCPDGGANAIGGEAFMWIYPGACMNLTNGGTENWQTFELNEGILSWYNTSSAKNQLNSSGVTYRYMAIMGVCW